MKQIEILDEDEFANATVKTCVFNYDKSYTGTTLIQGKDGDYILNSEHIFDSKIVSDIVSKIQPYLKGFKFTNIYSKVRSSDSNQTVVKVANADSLTLEEGKFTSPDSDKYRLVTGYMRNSFYHIDACQILEPGVQNKKGYVQYVCSSEQQAKNIKSVLDSKVAKFIFAQTRTSRSLDSSQLQFVPFLDDGEYTDEDLYTKLNLTVEEIAEIEQYVK